MTFIYNLRLLLGLIAAVISPFCLVKVNVILIKKKTFYWSPSFIVTLNFISRLHDLVCNIERGSTGGLRKVLQSK